jgi:hypothetical protein
MTSEESYTESPEILQALILHNPAILRTSGNTMPRGEKGQLLFQIREMKVSLSTIEAKVASGTIKPWVDPTQTCEALRRGIRRQENSLALRFPEQTKEHSK